MPSSPKITVPELRARKQQGGKVAMVTAYDATMAKLLEAGGADVLLVGDSLGMVVQGLPNTLPVTLDEVCYHGRAVARAAVRAHVMGDMPFMSYQASPEQAVQAAGRMLKQGGFESVKLEGGAEFAEHVRRIVACGIPVMGHIGLTPQSVHAMGGFRVQGRDAESAERLLADARALEQSGAFGLVLEGIPSDLATRITAAVSIPTVGIGAGPGCDGQVLVCYDFLGMYPDLRPRFVKRFAEVGEQIVEATRAYVAEVRGGAFPTEAHSFGSGPKAEVSGNRPVVGSLPPGYGPASGE
jgi:3-methyl-2-oxobutanoate hydroxymethyltransferase